MLRNILNNRNTSYFMEAHDAISAKIAEDAGFSGVWASSLTISATMGYRDCSEISWSMMQERAEQIKDSINIPLIVDADSGYGSFNNTRILAEKFQKLAIDGICIEDKLFPKTNSFVNSETQVLEDRNVFCGKIKAATEAKYKPDFCIIARNESFIVGNGLDDALRRSYSYIASGADAILIHSKKNDLSEIKAFVDEWKSAAPIIIVPTTYPLSKEDIENLNVSIVIWANHMLRASVYHMREVAELINKNKNTVCVKDRIVDIKEIFKYQDVDTYLEDEKKYGG